MQQNFSRLVRHLLFVGLAMIVSGTCASEASAQGFNVNIGSTMVDITPGSGIVNASIDIAIENPTADPLAIAGYSFFLEIEPVGAGLPDGVSLDTPAATYSSGNGVGLLLGANLDGTINLTPAAGDLGLGQIQFFDATVAAGASESLLTVNFSIDLGAVMPGEFSISLSADGQNSISSIDDVSQTFTSSPGTLTLANVPVVLGDVNCDGAVDFLDLGPFIEALASGEFSVKADINEDDAVDFLDLAPFIAILSAA